MRDGSTFPSLFSPFKLGSRSIKNRICFSPHGTGMAVDGQISDYLVEYHRVRAASGVGMIVTESNTVHASCAHPRWLTLADDRCIPGLKRLSAAVKPYGCTIIAQAIHPGRAAPATVNGSKGVMWDASGVFEERYHQTPADMPEKMVDELVDAYASAARRLKEGDFDGMEIAAAFGYLIAQFLNPRLNQRSDVYGGDLKSRAKLLLDIIRGVRAEVGRDFLLGMRLSVDELDPGGIELAEVTEICMLLDELGELDYLSLVEGGGASPRGWIMTVPPAPGTPDKVLTAARVLKQRISTPVIATSRINTPQLAEQALNSGAVDIVGMVRSLIADPRFVEKAFAGVSDDIRACVACNQACIGHRTLGARISCIQHPETGNEAQYFSKPRTSAPCRVFIVGGGPAGMKAAAVAAERGHETHLFEASEKLGGQVHLAQALPGRSEFGGVIDNLKREVEKFGVKVHLRNRVSADWLKQERPDLTIVATGAASPVYNEGNAIVCASDMIRHKTSLGRSVLVVDKRCDWVAPGVASMLAQAGHQVRLYVNGVHLGETLPVHIRDLLVGDLFSKGVEPRTYMRFEAFDDRTAYFSQMITNEIVEVPDVDTVVVAGPFTPDRLWRDLLGSGMQVTAIGDCVSPRTVEEAILEGLKAGFHAEKDSTWIQLGLERAFS
jgi:2,4-dienoyl-CoA reductase-like NADH-dependent reductase (Old Yellow Enzyme family)